MDQYGSLQEMIYILFKNENPGINSEHQCSEVISSTGPPEWEYPCVIIKVDIRKVCGSAVR